MNDQRKKEFKHRIYQYVLRLIRFLTKLPNEPVIAEIKRQLTRSGTSVGANYFEALAASSKKDFQNSKLFMVFRKSYLIIAAVVALGGAAQLLAVKLTCPKTFEAAIPVVIGASYSSTRLLLVSAT